MSSDKRLQTEQITPELIDYVTQKIVNAVKPQKVVLFGSHASGHANSDSDLDLFVVYGGRHSSRKIRQRIDSLLNGRLFSLDLIVRKPKEVDWNIKANNTFFIEDILEEGRVLYEQNA